MMTTAEVETLIGQLQSPLSAKRRSAAKKFEATMVLMAVGDAYVRLHRSTGNDPTPLFELSAIKNNELLFEGALRAVAMNEGWIFWAAAACPGWSGKTVDDFLDRCLRSGR